MTRTDNEGPLISLGSFLFAAAILAGGMLVAWNNANAGATGWSVYWPAAVAALVAALVNLFAVCSPGGSIFALARELIAEGLKPSGPR